MQNFLTYMLGIYVYICICDKCDFSGRIIVTPSDSVASNLHMNPILLILLTLLLTLSHLH